MATWNSRGLRGSSLEELINYSNEMYQEEGLALIQKIPTPIKPIVIDKHTRHITLAYFDQKSTVDYIGAVQGIPICFDAKECAKETFPLANLHEHQVSFMRAFEKQGGVAFLVIYFTMAEECYYMPFSQMEYFWNRMKAGGRKSFTYEEMDKTYRIGHRSNVPVHYLAMLQKDLENRDVAADGVMEQGGEDF